MLNGSSEYFVIKGSIIFESNKINSTKQEWRISRNDRVALTFVKQTYQIRLLTVVDLDVTNERRTSRYLLLKNSYQLVYILISIFDVQTQCKRLLQPSDNCVSGLQQFVQRLTCIRTGGLQLVSVKIERTITRNF